MDDKFKIPEEKQFYILMNIALKNLAYTQILERTILMSLLHLQPGSEAYQNQMDLMRAQAHAQVRDLYRTIYEDHGDVGLDELLADT